jgi:hypothetical protein
MRSYYNLIRSSYVSTLNSSDIESMICNFQTHSIFHKVFAVLLLLLLLLLWLYSPLLDLGRFFSFLILYTAGRTRWTGDQLVARPLLPHRKTQTENKRTQTSMPSVGFELTIPVFKRAKTVHDLDCAATVIGTVFF